MQTTTNEKENNEEANKEETHVKFNGTNYIYNKLSDNENTNTNTNKTIICIHGIGGYTGLFDDFLNLVSDGYNILRYDQIGRGYSDYPLDNKFGVEPHLNQLRDLIVHLGLHQTKHILLGHSMGGCLATLYTNKYPEEVEALILLAPAGLLERNTALKILDYCPRWINALVKIPLKCMQETWWRLSFVDHWSQSATQTVEKMQALYADSPTIFDALYECLFQFPLSNLEEEVITLSKNPTLPILLMWGKQDAVVSCETNFIKWARLLVTKEKLFACTLYEELGHDFFIEDPDKVLKEITVFLQHYLKKVL